MKSKTYASARWLIALVICICASIGSNPAPALAERWKTTPSGWWWLTDASEAEINAKAAEGYRVINIEVESTSPYRFSAIFVRNSGAHYQPTWGWWFDQTAAEVDEIVNGQPVRLIDIEVYSVGGLTRHAIVLVGNSGPGAKGSWHFTNKTWDEVGALLDDHNGRLIDFDTRLVSGVRKYDGIMIANTGADSDAWWRYSAAP